MKKFVFFLITFFLCVSIANADTIKIPFQCNPKKLVKTFKKAGIKLEINGDNKCEDSWGFIDNHGTHYDIVTYNSVTKEEFCTITKLVMER